MQSSPWCQSDRRSAVVPFAVVASIAIIAGGLIAAAAAHAPTHDVVWMVAYLVLIVGVAQLALAAGQAFLAVQAPAARWFITECFVFNIGNAAVIAGTLLDCFPVVAAGALLLLVTLALFLYGVRRVPRHWPLYAYHALLVFIAVSAIVGVILSAASGS